MISRISLAALAAISMTFGPGIDESVAAKSKKKGTTVREHMSEEQKAKLRKAAFEWCKKFGRVHHIEIKSNGQVVCYHYTPGW